MNLLYSTAYALKLNSFDSRYSSSEFIHIVKRSTHLPKHEPINLNVDSFPGHGIKECVGNGTSFGGSPINGSVILG